MIDRLTCILCPIGCDLEVEVERKDADKKMREGYWYAEETVNDDGGSENFSGNAGEEVENLAGVTGTNEQSRQVDSRVEGRVEDKTSEARVVEGSLTFPQAILWAEESAEGEEVRGREGLVVSKAGVRRYENAIDGRRVLVRGHQCDKGVDFAVEEVLHPKRNLASSVPLAGTADRMVSVRLSDRVPREMIFPILAEIAKFRPSLPVRRGDVLIPNVVGSGVDVIATRTIPGKCLL